MQPTPMLAKFIADIPPGSALDIGCAEGRNALFMVSKGWDVTAIDVQPMDLPDFVKFEQSSLDMFTSTDRYDLVVCLMVLHFLSDTRSVVENIQRLKKLTQPCGFLLISALTDQNKTSTRPYLFAKNELSSFFTGWKTLLNEYELAQPIVDKGRRVRYHVNRLIVQKPPE